MNKTKLFNFLLTINLLLFGSNVMSQTAEIAQTPQEANMALIGSFAENIFAKKDLSGLEQYMHEDYIQHNPLVGQGSEGFKTFFQNWFDTVPDFTYELKNIIANDEYVWVYGAYIGTHKGDWLGIPATDKAYNFNAVDIFRISDGKLAEHWDVLDVYSLFQQLGTIQ